MRSEALAHVGGLWAHDLVELAQDPGAVESGGRWAVVIPYDGTPVFARFARWTAERPAHARGAWSCGDRWSTSLDEESYVAGVRRIQEYIAAGDVYQVNLCRVLATEADGDIVTVHEALMDDNRSPCGDGQPGALPASIRQPSADQSDQGDRSESRTPPGQRRPRKHHDRRLDAQ